MRHCDDIIGTRGPRLRDEVFVWVHGGGGYYSLHWESLKFSGTVFNE